MCGGGGVGRGGGKEEKRKKGPQPGNTQVTGTTGYRCGVRCVCLVIVVYLVCLRGGTGRGYIPDCFRKGEEGEVLSPWLSPLLGVENRGKGRWECLRGRG